MKSFLAGFAVVIVLAVSYVPSAQADAFLRIDVNGTTVSCLASGACGAGFTPAGNSIQFTGTVNGVSFGGGGTVGVQVTGNQPGNLSIAFVLDTKTNLVNSSGAPRTVTVDFGGSDFIQPVGIGFLSASQAANWTLSAAGDTQAFTAWQRNDNSPSTIPGGNSTAASPNCVSPGGITQSCSSTSGDVPAAPVAPYALTGRQVISMANGTVFSGSGTAAVTAQSRGEIPEPSSVFLVGSGVLLFAGYRWRKRNK
jgi:hypothetical protein